MLFMIYKCIPLSWESRGDFPWGDISRWHLRARRRRLFKVWYNSNNFANSHHKSNYNCWYKITYSMEFVVWSQFHHDRSHRKKGNKPKLITILSFLIYSCVVILTKKNNIKKEKNAKRSENSKEWFGKKNILLIFCHINNIKIVREIHTKRNNQWIHIRILCKLDSWSYFLFSSILALASFVVHEYLSTWSAFREHTLDTFQSFFLLLFHHSFLARCWRCRKDFFNYEELEKCVGWLYNYKVSRCPIVKELIFFSCCLLP